MGYFYPNQNLSPEFLSDESRWRTELQSYTNDIIRHVTKESLLNFFIQNYTQNQDQKPITTLFWEYTRTDTIECMVRNIASMQSPNRIVYIKKTAISGRKIRDLIETITTQHNIRATELTNVSIVLQNNTTDPIRAYKLERENEVTQYVIIGNNHMPQRTRYICLGLTPNWFPNLLEGVEEEKVTAFKNLCNAIGNMNDDAYVRCVQACIENCIVPPLPEIDYSTVHLLIDYDTQNRIATLQNDQRSEQHTINQALERYEAAKTALQRIEWELSKLLAEPQKDDSENAIKIFKNFKSIVDYNYTNGMHNITIRSKMLIESDAIVKKILAPENHNAHNHYSIHCEEARRLLEDLWLNKTLQLEFCTTFYKDNRTAVPSCEAPTLPRITRNTMPNPHLIHYQCYGDNRRQLIDACHSNNLEYYLGSLTASNSNLNTGDATVLRRFCSDLFQRYNDTKLLYDVETKTYVSPRERMESYATV